VRKLLPLVALAVLPACVGPALWYDAYEGKAGATAAQMQSTVETARFVALVASRGKALSAYAGVALSDAERDASAIEGAFDSIQPPSPKADQLRDQLDQLLAKASSTISDMRIAARRDQLGSLQDIAAPLQEISDQLEKFAEAHAQ
jgi:ABC-type transporter Mla subunit MlaD